MADNYSLDNYVEVPERIKEFKKAHPDGSLQGEWELREIGGQIWVVYVAKALRAPDDAAPGVGTAWEPFPGKTPYTKDSELMNAETSAWGRAIVALGFVAQKVASREEVRNRQTSDRPNGSSGKVDSTSDYFPPSEKQLDMIERLVKKAGAEQEALAIRGYAQAKMTGGKQGTASQAIDALMGDKAADETAALAKVADQWSHTQTDVPAETEGLPVADDDAIPF